MSASLQILVMNGLVNCPLKGVIEAEPCFYCPWMEDIILESPTPVVACTLPPLDRLQNETLIS